jgi:putative ABC transport system substrate-binding protein
MTRRTIQATLLIACTIFFLAAGTAAAASRIALLITMDEGPFKEAVAGFNDYLGAQGVPPTYEVFSLEGNSAKVGPALQKIKQGRFDLIFTLGALATETAVKEIKDTPIIAGLILRPDILKKAPNATGVALEFSLETQFSVMRKMLPRAHTVGVIYSPQENLKKIEQAAAIARSMGLELEEQEVSSPQDVPAALDRLAQKADVLWGVPDTLVLSPQLAKPILLFQFRNSIPFAGPSATWVKAGALYSLDYDYRELGAQCAAMAQKVLQGAQPNVIPVQAPRSVKYSLNLNTARMIKVVLPDDIVRGAFHMY